MTPSAGHKSLSSDVPVKIRRPRFGERLTPSEGEPTPNPGDEVSHRLVTGRHHRMEAARGMEASRSGQAPPGAKAAPSLWLLVWPRLPEVGEGV